MGMLGSFLGRIIRAGEPDQQRRRYIYATPQDTKQDVSKASRRQVLGLARYFYYNNPVVRGAIDSITRNAIGPGIKCQARTDDEGWNRATEDYFRQWEGSCDVRGLLDWSAMQQVACRSMLRDNEVFIILTDGGSGYPQLQMVEAHRCESPGYLRDDRVFDGVRVNGAGRPLSYYLRAGDTGEFREVQAADLIVLSERDRPDELRSISRLVTCLNLLQDRDEILDHELQGVKRAGAIGLALEGAGPTGFFGPETTDAEGLTTDKVLGGGAIWNLPAGKTLKEIKNDRPGPNLTEFMDQILRAAAAGLGLPYEYLWKADLSGPSQRFVLAQAQRRFDEVAQAITTQLVARTRLWVLAKGIKRGDLTPPRGMDRWWTAVYHAPQRTTIDAGRDSAADREDLKLGLTTMAAIYASRGLDWQEAVDQKVSEQVYIRRKAEEAGLTVGDVQFIPQQGKPGVTPPSEAPAEEPAAQTRTAELEGETAAVTESFTMRDEPDYRLTAAELTMVADSLGLKDKKKEGVELAKPTAGMRAEARRGLEWRRKHGRGGTAVGVARARDIANGVDLPDETIGRMNSFFARHEVDKKGQGFSPGEPGYPSAGRIAWALWGGDAGQSWAAAQMRRIRREMAEPASRTPAPARDRIKGSKENRPGSAATRSKGGGIEISDETEQALKNKLSDFKKRYPGKKAPSLGTLKKVFRRGAGAYSQSHRPTIGGGRPNSRNAWAIARVNMFLRMVAGGKVKESYRKADGDLA